MKYKEYRGLRSVNGTRSPTGSDLAPENAGKLGAYPGKKGRAESPSLLYCPDIQAHGIPGGGPGAGCGCGAWSSENLPSVTSTVASWLFRV